ncbi:MAG: hypothetical protein C0621_08495 [Desulfuromonas sp.]|nr:MAG: hypothetical protein C0621_08495 [Desulfuromonas sp.]
MGCGNSLLFALLVLVWGIPVSSFAAGKGGASVDDWPQFLLGIAGGVTAHELGHVVVAGAHNYRLDHDGLSIVYHPDFRSRSERLRVASAGFQGQWLAAEIAFASGDRPGSFATGVICGHLATSLAYLVVLKNHPLGDTVSMAMASDLSVDQVASLAALPALLDLWRLAADAPPAWVPRLSLGLKGAGLAAVWSF